MSLRIEKTGILTLEVDPSLLNYDDPMSWVKISPEEGTLEKLKECDHLEIEVKPISLISMLGERPDV